MVNRVVLSFILNNVIFWENKGSKYNGTVGNIAMQFNKRSKFPVDINVVGSTLKKLEDDNVIKVYREEKDFGTNLTITKGYAFTAFAEYYNDAAGKKYIKI